MDDTENSQPPTPDTLPNLSIEAVILGLASDLESLRQGKISVQHAQAAANLGKQVMNGVKMMVLARNLLSEGGRDVTPQVENQQED